MCIIVDANAAHDLKNKTEDGRPVLNWLLDPKKKSGLVLGGKLTLELKKAGLQETLVTLSRAGRLHRFSAEEIAEKEKQLQLGKKCKSNDSHVVALALTSKCNVVFTKDIPLHADLKKYSETGIRISIYQNTSHSHLLAECHCKK